MVVVPRTDRLERGKRERTNDDGIITVEREGTGEGGGSGLS